jgi:hypothetical protein
MFSLYAFAKLCIQLYLCLSVLELWKTDLKSVNEKAAEALADPEKYPNLFPDLSYALQVGLCVCVRA